MSDERAISKLRNGDDTAKKDWRSSSSENCVLNDSVPPECRLVRGRAAEALISYRKLEAFHRMLNNRNADMVAYKELRRRWAPPRRHGHIDGVDVGLKLFSRGEAAIVGIHSRMMRGIDAVRGEPCYAVCVSGKYVDDDDHGFFGDGCVVYAGEGGQNNGHQVRDQKITVGIASLLLSIDSQLPIRVLRGRTMPRMRREYFYDGLYRCKGFSYGPSAEGPLVYKFKLVPIKHESMASITVKPDNRRSRPVQGKRLIDQKRKRDDHKKHINKLLDVPELTRENATKPFVEHW